MNGLMKKFEEDLYNLINNSNLQIGEAYYILKCSLLELERLYNDCVNEDLTGKTKKDFSETIDIPYEENKHIDLTNNLEENNIINKE